MHAGGGIKSTFSRKSWKERWFVLRNGILSYHKMIGLCLDATIGSC